MKNAKCKYLDIYDIFPEEWNCGKEDTKVHVQCTQREKEKLFPIYLYFVYMKEPTLKCEIYIKGNRKMNNINFQCMRSRERKSNKNGEIAPKSNRLWNGNNCL